MARLQTVGFETGDLTEVTISGGGFTVSTSYAHGGAGSAYGARLYNTGNTYYAILSMYSGIGVLGSTFPSIVTLYVKVFVKWIVGYPTLSFRDAA